MSPKQGIVWRCLGVVAIGLAILVAAALAMPDDFYLWELVFGAVVAAATVTIGAMVAASRRRS